MSAPNTPAGETSPGEHHSTITFNARLGLFLFVIYLAIYGTFVGMCAFSQASMAREVFSGVNLAVCFGFTLIVGAFVMAVIYLVLCRK